jgi:FkbM family methyltransferase
MTLQGLKSYLASRGPQSLLVRASLKAHGRMKGFSLRFTDREIVIRKNDREMILANAQYVQAPIMMECYELFFNTIVPQGANGRKVLDFSKPALHAYQRHGLSFHFPSVPEDDVMDTYTRWYAPKPDDVVWDVGAHAGASTCLLSRMVGEKGKVYAFEPDESNLKYLMQNLELHGTKNIVLLKEALSDSTGTAVFNMDGTMCAGIAEYLIYKGEEHRKLVPTITIEDACEKTGCVPAFVKMDIEGAEVAVICGAKEFLKTHAIHFAIETHRRADGTHSHQILDRFFPDIGYEVESSVWQGQMFTWARPKSQIESLDGSLSAFGHAA